MFEPVERDVERTACFERGTTKLFGAADDKAFGLEIGDSSHNPGGWCFPRAIEMEQSIDRGRIPAQTVGFDLLRHLLVDPPDDVEEGERNLKAGFHFPARQSVGMIVLPGLGVSVELAGEKMVRRAGHSCTNYITSIGKGRTTRCGRG